MTNIFPPESKLLRAPLLSKVSRLLDQLTMKDLVQFPSSSPQIISQQLESVELKLRDWLLDILELENYRYLYPNFGISQAIENWLVLEKRSVYCLEGDYKWIHYLRPNIHICKSLENIPANAVLYISNPSTIDGNFLTLWNNIQQYDFKVVLDCAYVGTTEKRKIPLSNQVEKVFFSFSKGFGLQNLRMGWTFSQDPIPTEQAFKDYAYISTATLSVTNKIISNLPIDFLYRELFHQQRSVCHHFDLIPSDCVLIGLSNHKDLRDFKRTSSSPARIPLTPYLNYD